MNKSIALSIVAAAGLSLSACETYGPGQSSGTLIGAGTGAVAGGILGHNVKGISATEGAIGGAILGGVAGNVIGRQQDQINEVKRNQQYQQGGYYDRYGRPIPPPPARYGY